MEAVVFWPALIGFLVGILVGAAGVVALTRRWEPETWWGGHRAGFSEGWEAARGEAAWEAQFAVRCERALGGQS